MFHPPLGIFFKKNHIHSPIFSCSSKCHTTQPITVFLSLSLPRKLLREFQSVAGNKFFYSHAHITNILCVILCIICVNWHFVCVRAESLLTLTLSPFFLPFASEMRYCVKKDEDKIWKDYRAWRSSSYTFTMSIYHIKKIREGKRVGKWGGESLWILDDEYCHNADFATYNKDLAL
jgi:hypothetical protein